MVHYGANPSADILRDIIILGQICEAACRTQLPINMLVDNLELFDELIKDALEYQGYSKERHNFSLIDTFNLLQIEERKRDKSYHWQFSLPYTMSSQEIISIGDLYIGEDGVSIGMPNSIIFYIKYPEVDNEVDRNCKLAISTCMTWILLAFTGFYFVEDSLYNSLYTSKENLDYNDLFYIDLSEYPVVDLFDLIGSLKKEGIINYENSRRN